MIQAILFDFNGVVINDEPLQFKAYQEVLHAEGVTHTEKDYYGSLGMDDTTFVSTAFARAGVAVTDERMRAVIERKAVLHRELLSGELPLFPGVVTFLKALARSFPLGVVSMARRAEIDYVLERAALARVFSVIVSAEDAHTCKPDPCCYNRALEMLNEKRSATGTPPLQPGECLVFEDSPPGIEAARVARMRTVGVTNTVSEKELRAAGAEVVTASLADWTPDAVRLIFDKG